ncbi:hypothetical protein ElyMa_002354600 [Elysia marginata]|uniref:Uncharacterized protein n=1 Tax=Elysia marginata TaxID=1093978 RepID=A0AAV4GBL9_9GAST|nr:hypothetical protein ElyMa_002354600 [Elysia marginata]
MPLLWSSFSYNATAVTSIPATGGGNDNDDDVEHDDGDDDGVDDDDDNDDGDDDDFGVCFTHRTRVSPLYSIL